MSHPLSTRAIAARLGNTGFRTRERIDSFLQTALRLLWADCASKHSDEYATVILFRLVARSTDLEGTASFDVPDWLMTEFRTHRTAIAASFEPASRSDRTVFDDETAEPFCPKQIRFDGMADRVSEGVRRTLSDKLRVSAWSPFDSLLRDDPAFRRYLRGRDSDPALNFRE